MQDTLLYGGDKEPRDYSSMGFWGPNTINVIEFGP